MLAKHEARHKILQLNNKRNREATTTKCSEKNINLPDEKVYASISSSRNKFPDWIELEITRVPRENKKHTIGGKGKEIVVHNLQYNSKKFKQHIVINQNSIWGIR